MRLRRGGRPPIARSGRLGWRVRSALALVLTLLSLSWHSESVAAGVTATLMQGVAAGTLLYVVFFEVLEPQRASRHAGIRQLLAVTAGFGAMFAIQLAGPCHTLHAAEAKGSI